MNNVNKNRAERPDKSLFFAMMGAFFLLFAIAPAYWAFYNYGEYSRTTAFVQDLQKKSDTDVDADRTAGTQSENFVFKFESQPLSARNGFERRGRFGFIRHRAFAFQKGFQCAKQKKLLRKN